MVNNKAKGKIHQIKTEVLQLITLATSINKITPKIDFCFETEDGEIKDGQNDYAMYSK